MAMETDDLVTTLTVLHRGAAYRTNQIETEIGRLSSKPQPTRTDKLRALGFILYYSEMYEQALAVLNALAAQDPSFENVAKLGWCQLRLGHVEDASKSAEHLVKLRDIDPLGHELSAAVSLERGDMQTAATAAQKALELGGSTRSADIFELAGKQSVQVDKARATHDGGVLAMLGVRSNPAALMKTVFRAEGGRVSKLDMVSQPSAA